VVSGETTLAGFIDVSLFGGFTPVADQQFNVLTAANIVDNGVTLAGPAANFFKLLVNSSSVTLQAVGLPGDYNVNGIVDAADYVVWRNMVGQSGPGLAADGSGPNGSPDGIVNQLDYDFWRANFGRSGIANAVASTSDSAAVPETGTYILALIAILSAIQLFRSR
jgi:hypothetical protein